MTVSVGALQLSVPLINGSGAFDITSAEPNWRADADIARSLGAYVTKTVTLHSRIGNPSPRIAVLDGGGAINAVGIANPGVQQAVIDWRATLESIHIPIILSVYGLPHELEQIVVIAEQDAPWIAGYEINLSCPNIADRASLDVAQSVRRVRSRTDKTLLAKLAPLTGEIASWAVAAVDAGADAIAAVNTTRIETPTLGGRRLLGSQMCGLSGPGLRELAIECVRLTSSAVDVPVIGLGGVSSHVHAEELFDAGATVVGVGCAGRLDPTCIAQLASGMRTAGSMAHAGNFREIFPLHGIA